MLLNMKSEFKAFVSTHYGVIKSIHTTNNSLLKGIQNLFSGLKEKNYKRKQKLKGRGKENAQGF